MRQQLDGNHTTANAREGMRYRTWHRLIGGAVCVVISLMMSAPLLAGSNSGLPLPRFASLKSETINMRTGPGTRYPVRWMYQRKGLPIEIIDEFDSWRKVRDHTGETGWVFKSMLSGRRTAIFLSHIGQLHSAPEKESPVILRIESGVIADIITCQAQWCKLQVDNVKGWSPMGQLWGVYQEELLE